MCKIEIHVNMLKFTVKTEHLWLKRKVLWGVSGPANTIYFNKYQLLIFQLDVFESTRRYEMLDFLATLRQQQTRYKHNTNILSPLKLCLQL